MVKLILSALLVLALARDCYARHVVKIPAREEYRYAAHVVEYPPVVHSTPCLTIQDNVNHYELLILKSDPGGIPADIVVFPEYGLTTTAPSQNRNLCIEIGQEIGEPDGQTIPCLDYESSNVHQEILQRISCTARKSKKYVVINVIERLRCETCSDGFLIYNTNVAFDRNGTLVARYRKFNLYGEPALNITAEPEMSIFKTDFGATFGLFACMDILYQKPAMQLSSYGVTDVAFPTAWISELPFLTALQTQAAWSAGTNINLLASGYSRPNVGHTGSAIYAGSRGMISGIYTEYELTAAISVFAQIPAEDDLNNKKQHLPHVKNIVHRKLRSNISSYEFRLKEEDMSNYTSTDIFVDHDSLTVLCTPDNDMGEFCCEAEYFLTRPPEWPVEFYYKLLTFNGWRMHDGGRYQTRSQVCAVVACTGNDTQSCAEPFDETYYPLLANFTKLRISATFYSKYVQPNTLDNSLYAMPAHFYSFGVSQEPNGTRYDATINITEPKKIIRTFGLYSHDVPL